MNGYPASNRAFLTWCNAPAVTLFALLFTLSLLLHLSLRLLTYDDAFIHFRVANNLASGFGPYYNHGERVFGTSSPIWTALLGITFFLVGPSPLSVAVLNSLFSVLAALVFARVAEGNSERITSLYVLAAVAIFGALLTSSIGLMETPLAMLFFALSLRTDRPGSVRGALFAVLATFTRLELGLLLLWMLVHHRREGMKFCLWVGAMILPFVAVLLYWFQTLIPHTILAKKTVYSVTAGENVQLFFSGHLWGDGGTAL